MKREAERAIAANTWEARRSRDGFGWHQNPIMAAMQGFTDEAKNYVISNSKRIHPGFRFPVMWDANYDWVPDQDHGSVLLTSVQYMAMQYEGDRILLLPAWPKDWDAHFKLHAPRQTTVECKVESGKITLLKVTPESRKKDVVLLEGWQAP